ncbi:MAG: GTP cyclohydrolase I FolE [Phycisphaerales bacterium]|nr:GTP cyclohydrolase I FolE [Phycisphaerales bacterium]NNM27264.1 GTP cyclohydrolase I FolE [Phycisphaerales bacterium]
MSRLSAEPDTNDHQPASASDGVVAPEEQAAMENVRALLSFIGEDPSREGLVDTPRRVIGAMRDHFRGYRENPESYLERTFTEVEGYNELVLISDIELHSHCEHHMVPFVGKAHVAYIPDGKVVGLSKIARVVDAYAKRLQVQEKLTAQIAGSIWDALRPQGVAVILQCQHFCMCYRGVRKPGSWTTTSKLHGCFLNDEASRQELLTLISMPKDIG